jgi:MATE family multidrug resistance protein
MSSRPERRSELAATLRLAWPLVISQIAAVGQHVIEIVLAGHLDAHVLAAVAIGTNVVMIPLMAMIGTMYATPASVAQLDGAGQRRRVAALGVQAAWLGLLIGLLMLAIVRWGGPFLVDLAGIPPSLAADVTRFLHAVCFAMPAIGLFVACRGVSDGVSMPAPSMVLSLAGLVLLLPLGYVLMYGAFGLPRLGAAGTGYAGAIVNWMQALVYFAFLRFAPRYRGIGWAEARRLRPDPAVMMGLLRVGVPMGVAALMEVGMFSLAGLAIGRLGEIAAASHQVAMSAASVTFMVPLGLASAITVRVGNAAGRRDPAGIRRAGFTGFALVACTQTISATVMLSAPAWIAELYTGDPRVVAGVTLLLQIAGVFQLSDGLQVACNGALRGLKDTRVPMLLTAIAYWGVGVPLGLLLAFAAGWRTPGMWIGLTVGLTTAAALLGGRFVLSTRRRAAVAVA